MRSSCVFVNTEEECGWGGGGGGVGVEVGGRSSAIRAKN